LLGHKTSSFTQIRFNRAQNIPRFPPTYNHELPIISTMADTVKANPSTEEIDDASLPDKNDRNPETNRLALAQNMSAEEFVTAEKELKRKLDIRLLACVWFIFILNYLDRVRSPSTTMCFFKTNSDPGKNRTTSLPQRLLASPKLSI
jgi:hypothetical protein